MLVSTNQMNETRVRNDLTDHTKTFSRGRSLLVLALWQVVKCLFFMTSFPVPSVVKAFLIRLFGGQVGRGVLLKARINIHFPWRLRIGDHAWIGEDVMLLNLEQIRIGAHACVSQRAFLCTGNHNFRDPEMPYRNGPIVVEDGAWIGAQAFVAPGVVVGVDAVVSAGSVVRRSLESNGVYSGNPAMRAGDRWV